MLFKAGDTFKIFVDFHEIKPDSLIKKNFINMMPVRWV